MTDIIDNDENQPLLHNSMRSDTDTSKDVGSLNSDENNTFIHSHKRNVDYRRKCSGGFTQEYEDFYNPSDYNSNSKPLFQRLLSSQHAVTNPGSICDNGLNSSSLSLGLNSSGIENGFGPGDIEDQRRLSILGSMRPARLIGNYTSRFEWMDAYRDTTKLKRGDVKSYYKSQNYLIEKFKEIDNFLDAGQIHINMLTNYSNNGKKFNSLSAISEDTSPRIEQSATALESANNPSYDTVNSKISRFNEVPGNLENDGAKFLGYNEEENNKEVVLAIMVNFFINFVLLLGKIVVTIMTNSMSIVASLVDSVLDFLSTFIIYIANKLSRTKNWRTQHSYPIGRTRLEPLGILIFSVIIILSFFQVGEQSFKNLFHSADDMVPVKIGNAAIAIMTFTVVSKIACWVWCAKSKSSAVQALAQDAMTDVIFNIVSLVMPTVGYIFDIWWLDSFCALLLSAYIIISWSKTAFEHIDNLTGAIASQLDYKVILYLAYRFAESIKQITALKVYHVGDNLNVEIDIVFAYEEFNLSIKDCHDIAEALQYAIESLPNVERAFVHIDYMEGNFKGHLN